MGIKKQLSRNSAALLLVIALLLPAAIQFIHAFEGHEHSACNEQTAHLHQTPETCKICDFHLNSFKFDFAAFPEFSTVTLPSKVEKNWTAPFFTSFKITNTQLRAPPHFLS